MSLPCVSLLTIYIQVRSYFIRLVVATKCLVYDQIKGKVYIRTLQGY